VGGVILRNARQFALQVLGVFRAVFGMMQNPVDVIEDVSLDRLARPFKGLRTPGGLLFGSELR
jgi:hypothetical protein